MKPVLHLFFLALFGNLALSFDCPDITNQSKCDTLGPDCAWIDSACSGSYFATGCTGCIYVDKYSTAGTPSGSLSNPYLDLNTAIASANTPSSVSTFIILNYKEVTEVDLKVVVVVEGKLTVK